MPKHTNVISWLAGSGEMVIYVFLLSGEMVIYVFLLGISSHSNQKE